MKNAILWDVTPCGSCKNRHFGGTYRLRHQDEITKLLVTANVLGSPILFTLVMEAIVSSETSVLTKATRRPITLLSIRLMLGDLTKKRRVARNSRTIEGVVHDQVLLVTM
jgi:hypothetical protein